MVRLGRHATIWRRLKRSYALAASGMVPIRSTITSLSTRCNAGYRARDRYSASREPMSPGSGCRLKDQKWWENENRASQAVDELTGDGTDDHFTGCRSTEARHDDVRDAPLGHQSRQLIDHRPGAHFHLCRRRGCSGDRSQVPLRFGPAIGCGRWGRPGEHVSQREWGRPLRGEACTQWNCELGQWRSVQRDKQAPPLRLRQQCRVWPHMPEENGDRAAYHRPPGNAAVPPALGGAQGMGSDGNGIGGIPAGCRVYCRCRVYSPQRVVLHGDPFAPQLCRQGREVVLAIELLMLGSDVNENQRAVSAGESLRIREDRGSEVGAVEWYQNAAHGLLLVSEPRVKHCSV